MASIVSTTIDTTTLLLMSPAGKLSVRIDEVCYVENVRWSRKQTSIPVTLPLSTVTTLVVSLFLAASPVSYFVCTSPVPTICRQLGSTGASVGLGHPTAEAVVLVYCRSTRFAADVGYQLK